MKRIRVDFNAQDGEGRYPTLRKFADDSVRIRDRVLAYDRDGNQALGIVTGFEDDGVVVLELDMSTFNNVPAASSGRGPTQRAAG